MLKSTGDKHGLEIRAAFSLLNEFKALGGSGPWEYPEFFLISLFRSAEMTLKSLIARRKNDVNPMNPQISLIDLGAGQFLMTSVFASPGDIPLLLHMS